MEKSRKTAVLADLKAQIRRLERLSSTTGPAVHGLPLVPPIDRLWPENGLPLGCLHEIQGTQDVASLGALTSFAAAIGGRLAKTSQHTLWCGRTAQAEAPGLYGPGLAQAGLAPAQLIIVTAASDADVLAAMEEGLRHPVLACVVGEVRRMDLTASRRLQLAAEKSGVTALAIRMPQRRDAIEPIAAAGRWRITVLPSASHVIPAAGRARWRLELLQSRCGAVGEWIVEAPDAQGHLGLSTALDNGVAQTPLGHERRLAAG
jgi:protein ImuA